MRDIVLRRARDDESDAVAALFRLSLQTGLPFLAERHTLEEDRAFFRDRVFTACDVWVAERDGELVGLCAFREGWVDHLYVHPAHHRSGIGAALLRRRKTRTSSCSSGRSSATRTRCGSTSRKASGW